MLIGKILKLPRTKLPQDSTLMFVPHSQQSIYKIRIPFMVLIIFFASVFCLSVIIAYSSVKYTSMKENMAELEALRTINKQQEKQLRLIEEEVVTMREKMEELELLERDVRNMLESDSFAGRPLALKREQPPSRGGGRDHPGAEQIDTGWFFERRPSYRERKEEWDAIYTGTRQVAGELLANLDSFKQDMALLKQDVMKKKEYLDARPNGMPAAGEISSGFGPRKSPFSRRTEIHPAIDIAADYGAPVMATGKGVVVFAGYRPGYGKTVVIRHGYGFQTVYCHNSSISVEAGQEVTRGQVIARVGSSGASTGPHLHYEVLLNGVRVDPTPYL